MLCAKCQQREATCHVNSFTFPAGEMTKSDLCEQCFEESTPYGAEVTAAFRSGCHYCGGEPVCSAPDLGAGDAGQKTVALCGSCNEELYRLVNLRFPGLMDGSITKEQIADPAAIFTEIHEHMKKWASDRRGP
jgi:protein-arginine kinase activator protein McsA